MESSFRHGILACLYRDPEDYLWYDEFTREPAQGCYRNHFANDMIEEETHFNQGRGIGIHRKWWPDGSLRCESHLANGFLDGRASTGISTARYRVNLTGKPAQITAATRLGGRTGIRGVNNIGTMVSCSRRLTSARKAHRFYELHCPLDEHAAKKSFFCPSHS